MKRNLTLAVLTGIMVALSFPPFKTGFLAFAALIPFFLLLERKKGTEAFRWAYVTGLFIDIFSLFWLGWVTLPGLIGALLILPLYFALFGVLHSFLYRRLENVAYLVAPFLWTAIEYLQSFGETAFPWTYLGYSQTYYLPFIQFAEYTSVYGVSFWIVLINALFYLLWRANLSAAKRYTVAAVLAGLVIVPFVHGEITLRQRSDGGKIKVALLQGNVDPFEKWDDDLYERNFAVYERLMKKAAVEQPDLYIWPETATPFYLRYEFRYLQRMRQMVDSLGAPILTGALDYETRRDGNYDYFNAALFIKPFSLRIQKYAKMKLVPFSERVPYKQFFPFNVLKNLLYDMALGIGDYARGDRFTIFRFKPSRQYSGKAADEKQEIRFASPICYESVFPALVRQFVKKGVDFLVIITNDAWFGKTSAPYQHAQIAVFRAIENRRSIARCANTGVSCFIDPYGRVLKATKIFQPAVLVDDIPLNREMTFYTKHGNVFALAVSIIALLSLFASFLFRIKVI